MRYLLMITAIASLAIGIWAGLSRLGIAAGGPALAHGPLMVSGFLGTLISIERAVGLGRKWTFSAPFLSALGAIFLLLGLPYWKVLFILSSFMLVAATILTIKIQPEIHSFIMSAGAGFWLTGNILSYLGKPAVFWWLGFPILTILGERLLLSRLRAPSRTAVTIFSLSVLLYFYTSAAVIVMVIWLLRYDVAVKTIKNPGLPKFAAICILSGYFWLFVHGVLTLTNGSLDARLHSIWLGFMMPMIFGHAPIILPAVTGIGIPFSRWAYIPLVLLHISLAMRLFIPSMFLPGVSLNAIAIGLFFVITVLAAIAKSLKSKISMLKNPS